MHLQEGEIELLAAQLHAGPHGRLAAAGKAVRRARAAAAAIQVALGRTAEGAVAPAVVVIHDVLGGHRCCRGALHAICIRLRLLLVLLLLCQAD